MSVNAESFGAGYAGPLHSPLVVNDPSRGVENLQPADSLAAFDRRLSLLEAVETEFLDRLQAPPAEAHLKTYQRAASLMHSSKAKAFDLSQESDATRDRYGRS